MRRIALYFTFMWICAYALPVSSLTISWVNDGGNGWDDGEAIGQQDMDNIKLAVDDNNTRIGILEGATDDTCSNTGCTITTGDTIVLDNATLTNLIDHAILMGDGAGSGAYTPAVPNCAAAGEALNFTQATNTFACVALVPDTAPYTAITAAGEVPPSELGADIPGSKLQDATVTMAKIDPTIDFLTSGTIRGNVDVIEDATTSRAVTADECRGSFHISDGTGAMAYTLPTAAAGLSCCFYDQDGTVLMQLVPNTGDQIVLDGTPNGVGNSIDSAAGAGDFICVLAKDVTDWLTLGRSGAWVDTP